MAAPAPVSAGGAEVAFDFALATRAFADVCHENVLAVEDLRFDARGRPFAVASRFTGRSLAGIAEVAVARSNPLPLRSVLGIVLRVADAAQVLSRSLGPLGGLASDSVWVLEGARIVLMPSALSRRSLSGGDAVRAGTPRGDVHALGSLLWGLLVVGRSATFRMPTECTRAEPIPFDDGIVRLVMRALSTDAREQYPDVAAFGAALAALANGATARVEEAGRVIPEPSAPARFLSVMPSPRRLVSEPAGVAPGPFSVQPPAEDKAVAELRTVRGSNEDRLMLSRAAERWVVGRAGSADLALPDPDVSRHHFEIVREKSGTYRIHDLGSKNGLFVNGSPTEDGPLRAGDEVRAGATVLRFIA